MRRHDNINSLKSQLVGMLTTGFPKTNFSNKADEQTPEPKQVNANDEQK